MDSNRLIRPFGYAFGEEIELRAPIRDRPKWWAAIRGTGAGAARQPDRAAPSRVPRGREVAPVDPGSDRQSARCTATNSCPASSL